MKALIHKNEHISHTHIQCVGKRGNMRIDWYPVKKTSTWDGQFKCIYNKHRYSYMVNLWP